MAPITHRKRRAERMLQSGEPIALAYSGGGDSTALLHMLRHRLPKPVVLIVDHNLREMSRDDAETAATFARGLDCEADILTWDHENPTTGIQEKARIARYSLLGEACRARGINYLLTGHTLDDQAETLQMRNERVGDEMSSVGMMDVTYAPVWPQLADVTILRPLLGFTRDYLRQYNQQNGLRWIEDPSNENMDFTRVKVRKHLAKRSSLKKRLLKSADKVFEMRQQDYAVFRKMTRIWHYGWAGDIRLQNIPRPELLMFALRAVGGQSGDVSLKKVTELHRKWVIGEIHCFTLSGAKIFRDKGQVIICRDPVAVTGRSDGNLEPTAVPTMLTAEPLIWDGRFNVTTQAPGYEIRANYDLDTPRSPELEKHLKGLHPDVRKTAPVVVFKGTAYAISEARDVECRALVKHRIDATLDIDGPVLA